MPSSLIPAGFAPVTQVAQQFDMSENAVRLTARRRQIRGVLIRGRLYVHVPDLERLFEPQPYPPTAA